MFKKITLQLAGFPARYPRHSFLLFSLMFMPVMSHAVNSCHVQLASNATVYSSADAAALQQAIDNATAGDTLKISGTCAGVQTVNGKVQSVYVSKSLTLQGGYDGVDWSTSNPLENNSSASFFESP